MKTDYTSIDQYIRSFPAPTRKILIELQEKEKNRERNS